MFREYIKKGWSVIPLIKNDKRPAIKWEEFQKRYATEEEIKSWEAAGYGVGIVTGQISRLTVIDQDSEEGGNFLRQFNLRGPKVKTLKEAGWHYYCGYPATGISNSVKKFPGMDIRGEGGYVVAPPTVINGKQYTWVGGMNRPLVPIPEALLGASKVAIAGVKPSPSSDTPVSMVKVGARHSFLVQVAGALRRQGLGPEAIFQGVKAAYEEKCEKMAGDSDAKLRQLAASMEKYEPAKYSVPAVEQPLGSLEDFLASEEKVEWIVPSLIARGAIGFVAGLPESCKTWLLMDLAISVASGQDWLGLFKAKQGKVLFIDQERFAGETRRRIKSLLAGRGLSAPDLGGRLIVQAGSNRKIDLDPSYEALQRDLADLKPDLMIVDSFTTFHTKDESSKIDIQKVLERCKELRTKFGVTVLFICHESKGAYQDQQEGDKAPPNLVRLGGSIAIPAAAEFVMTVRTKAKGMSGVYVTKSTLAKACEPFIVTVEDMNAEQSKIAVRGRNL